VDLKFLFIFHYTYNGKVLFADFMMKLFKQSIIGSVLLLTSLIRYFNQYRDNGVFEIFSPASVFLLLGSLAFYFEYGNDKTKDGTDEEE
tara:strand:- start:1290 stop:1556 length:267 start_codon:yes stop_codon:yes gene_type:complete